jgi:hypothetical protein
MKRPPRARTERLVSLRLVSFSYLQIGVIAALVPTALRRSVDLLTSHQAGFFLYLIAMSLQGYDITKLAGTGFAWQDEDTLIFGIAVICVVSFFPLSSLSLSVCVCVCALVSRTALCRPRL